jgi:glutamine cyclotransferase
MSAAITALPAQLEFIGGEVWANVWQSACIARICPETGKVKGWLLMHGLRQSLADRNLASNSMDVLNGEDGIQLAGMITCGVA